MSNFLALKANILANNKINRSKSCKKDLWTQINAALQSNSKWQRLDAVNSLTEIIPANPSQPSSTSTPSVTSSTSSTTTTPISPGTSSQALYAHSFQSFCDITTPNSIQQTHRLPKQNLNLPQQQVAQAAAAASQQIFPAMFAIAAGQQAGTPIDLIVDFSNFTVLSMSQQPQSSSSLSLPLPSLQQTTASSTNSAHERKWFSQSQVFIWFLLKFLFSLYFWLKYFVTFRPIFRRRN